MGSGPKSYMIIGLLIYGNIIFAHFLIYSETIPLI